MRGTLRRAIWVAGLACVLLAADTAQAQLFRRGGGVGMGYGGGYYPSNMGWGYPGYGYSGYGAYRGGAFPGGFNPYSYTSGLTGMNYTSGYYAYPGYGSNYPGYGYGTPYDYGMMSPYSSAYASYPSYGGYYSSGYPYTGYTGTYTSAYGGTPGYFPAAAVIGDTTGASGLMQASYTMPGMMMGGNFARDANAALLTVKLPDPNADVTVDGAPTRSRGTTREYMSPPLQKGHDYYYTLKARWNENGQEKTATKRIAVHPGDRLDVDLTKPNS